MLILICGLPNAGKTTHSSKYDTVIHLDDMPHKGGQFENCNRIASEMKGDVCVEGVYNSVKNRKRLLKACKHQEKKVCIWIDTPLEECVRRESEYRKRPINMVRTHYKLFEKPTLDEGWDEVIVIKEGEE